MRTYPSPVSDEINLAAFAQNGEIGESFYGSPAITLEKDAEFGMTTTDHGNRVIGFVKTNAVQGAKTECRLRLAKVKIQDGNIGGHYLTGGPFRAPGTISASQVPTGVQIDHATRNTWASGFVNRSFPLAPNQQLQFQVGSYNLFVDLRHVTNFAMSGETEHGDDFELAFKLVCEAVEFFVNRNTQRTHTFSVHDSTLKYDPGALEQQEIAYRRVIVQDLIQDLRFQRPELLPGQLELETGPEQLIAALETHWGRCLGGLRDLSKIRDYNRSHSANGQILVTRLPVANQPQQQGLNVNPSVRQAPTGPVWNVNPLLAPRGNVQQPLVTPGQMVLQYHPANALWGNSAGLISFTNPFFKESYSMNLSKNTPGVRDFRW